MKLSFLCDRIKDESIQPQQADLSLALLQFHSIVNYSTSIIKHL